MRCPASLRCAVATCRSTAAGPGPDRGTSRRPAGPWAWLPLAACLLWLPALSVDAQSTQYTAPGGGTAYDLPTAESIEAEMEAARWRLGPLRLAPWLGLRGLTYEPEVFETGDDGEVAERDTSDVTGSVGAGLTAYLPTGGSVFWIAQVMPEYVFWLDLDERNELIGRYGAGVVADLNRLRLVGDAHRTEEQGVVSLESPQRAVTETEGVSGDAALEISPSFAVTTSAAVDDLTFRVAGDEAGTSGFSRLDREERRLAGGLRFQPRDAVAVELGVERTESDFAAGARDLSSTGTSPYLRLELTGNKIALDSEVSYRELEPEPGSLLVPVEEVAGRARLELTPGWRFTFGLYGHRNVVFAIADDYSSFVDSRVGGDVAAPFGERLVARLFAETGSADFVALDPAAGPSREDDVTAYGGDLTFEIGEWLAFRAGFDQVEIESNLPEFDRDYARVTSSFVVSTGRWVWR